MPQQGDTPFHLPHSLVCTYSLEGCERDVGDELSAGRGHGETNGLVLDSVFLAGGELEDILEDLVESELAEALSSVADQGGEPALN